MTLRLPLCALLLATACTGGTLTRPTVLGAATPTDITLMEQAVTAQSGRALRADLSDITLYTLADGSRIGCGQWGAPDPYGSYGGRAPFYVRYTGNQILRVHLDDLTGYGPARTGCDSAAARASG